MRYTVGELARLSGVSTRTLRLYDQAGLLTPERNPENGYRLYGDSHVDRLQQILFYRELGVGLEQIKQALDAPGYDRMAALRAHEKALMAQRQSVDALLLNVRNTIKALNGGKTMKDVEKFEGFKREALQENERKYGQELRRAYGDETVDASQRKVSGMTEQQWNGANEMNQQIHSLLREAMKEGDPAGKAAQKACALHREWLCLHWPEGMYTPEMHLAMGESYVTDERFTRYYDDACGRGAAAFFCEALKVYTAAQA